MIIRSIAVVWAIIGSCACTQAPTSVSASGVYNELVEAGCMKADPDGGIVAVSQEMAMAHPPSWVGCLAEGGTVLGCMVPCDSGK